MRLLVVTQVVDRQDLYLGFFTRWIEELAPQFEAIEVICLKEGEHSLPKNVRVHSLGKEHGRVSRFRYICRFLALAWKLRPGYDRVFVHMNQEYVLLAGLLWKILGKRIYMWRNHYSGSWLTDVATVFCTKVFCTSRFSFTAKYKKAVLMPVGVDTERFHPDATTSRKPDSILFFGRMSPSKNPLLLLDALRELAGHGVAFTATFAGTPLPEHEGYYRSLMGRAEQYGLGDRVMFVPGIPNHKTPDLYRTHGIYVNAGRSGMFDKTLFEAAACGCVVLAASEDFRDMIGDEVSFTLDVASLSERLEMCLTQPQESRAILTTKLTEAVRKNSLQALAASLKREIAP